MCLAIPGKIKKIDKDLAIVDFGGVDSEISLMLVESAVVGDWILAHAGVAIKKITQKDAKNILKAIKGDI
jgi:hydrogenase expression/formation protein HypC